MEPIIVLSPHLDDAVLSAGRFLASYPGAKVLTVFAGCPVHPVSTTFDAHSGFVDSDDALARRWDEDDRALAAVGADPYRLSFLDHQYQPDRDGGLVADIAHIVLEAVAATGASKVVAPLGLAHPDHLLVTQAAMQVAATGVEMWTYEDLPNRVLLPEEVPPALDRWRAAGFNPVFGFLGAARSNDEKRRAVDCYESQLWALDRDVLFVPERFWRQWPTD